MSADRPVDLMVVGAQKAATSSLLRLLGAHPDVTGHADLPEVNYFVDDELHRRGWAHSATLHYGTGTRESGPGSARAPA